MVEWSALLAGLSLLGSKVGTRSTSESRSGGKMAREGGVVTDGVL